MGGFLPKPVSKVSWIEVLTPMWGGETHPTSDPSSRGISKTSDQTHRQTEKKKGEEEKGEDKESHHMKQANDFTFCFK